MDFRIADTFTESLARLTGEEQKAVKTTAFDLQINPASPGLSFHRLEKAKDKNFWSVRVNQGVRLIVHRTAQSLLLCYVDHHDKAYAWAQRRKLETHPTTGAAQFVEVRERVQEILIPIYVPRPAATVSKQPLFASLPDAELLRYGVPPEWLADVRQATEDTLLTIADHLPAEAAEALLEVATGGAPRISAATAPAADPFEHPDAQRRFRVMTDVGELARALEYPWERWTVFLHPAQRELVERRFGGPARIAGSAGTGKTVVALHRAAHLARMNSGARILLTTFSESLASALRIKLSRLIGTEPRLLERIDVDALDAVARSLHHRMLGRVELASRDIVRDVVCEASSGVSDNRFSPTFLLAEWTDVVDAWQLDSWEAYRGVARLGRKTRLPEKQRLVLWEVFERARAEMRERRLVTHAEVYRHLSDRFSGGERSPYDFVVVDESQDVSVPQLRFVAALGGTRPDALFFAGDLGQRIFQAPFSWLSLGIDVRGRSATLRINYRTSHQIRAQADRLLGHQITDVDGNTEERRATISVFNGPDPVVCVLATPAEESRTVATWLAERAAEGIPPTEMAVFVRSPIEIPRAQAAVEGAGLAPAVLGGDVKTPRDRVPIATMHLSKGLEFRAVAVMACDDEVLPLQSRVEGVTDESDLRDVYDTERHLLYVACTRARDRLHVTGVTPGSEFLQDLQR